MRESRKGDILGMEESLRSQLSEKSSIIDKLSKLLAATNQQIQLSKAKSEQQNAILQEQWMEFLELTQTGYRSEGSYNRHTVSRKLFGDPGKSSSKADEPIQKESSTNDSTRFLTTTRFDLEESVKSESATNNSTRFLPT